MKGIIAYSSNTGNTQKLAEEIYAGVKQDLEWSLKNIDDVEDINSYDVILLGGWAENGHLNDEALEVFKQIDKENKQVGLFMTMGAGSETEHGAFCKINLINLLEQVKHSLGYQIMQGKIAQSLMDKLAKAPEHMLPPSVKVSMQTGVDTYKEPTKEEYQAVAVYFSNKL